MDCTALDCNVCRVRADGDCVADCICRAGIYGVWERMVDNPGSICSRGVHQRLHEEEKV